MYIVEIEENVWIAPWDGDPGRCYKIYNAEKFNDKKSAEKALRKAREFRPFAKAKIIFDR